jgi:hypothetical protein
MENHRNQRITRPQSRYSASEKTAQDRESNGQAAPSDRTPALCVLTLIIVCFVIVYSAVD